MLIAIPIIVAFLVILMLVLWQHKEIKTLVGERNLLKQQNVELRSQASAEFICHNVLVDGVDDAGKSTFIDRVLKPGLTDEQLKSNSTATVVFKIHNPVPLVS
ncbi:MAG: hypothetical protein MJE77_17070 [Proteobacteria bacterium]|nr:hypothetical protein [Pseudomonadota bacterium]